MKRTSDGGWDWDAEYAAYCSEAEERGEPHPWYEQSESEPVPNKFKLARYELEDEAA